MSSVLRQPERQRRIDGGSAATDSGPEDFGAYREWQNARETANRVFESLSRREQQVAVLVTVGLTNDAMARFMEISHKTVEKHRTNLYRKLGVTDMSFVAALVIIAGLLKYPLRHHSSFTRYESWTKLITAECRELFSS